MTPRDIIHRHAAGAVVTARLVLDPPGHFATGGMARSDISPVATRAARSPQNEQSLIDADAAEAALIARYRNRVETGRRLARRVQSGEPLFLAVLATALALLLFMPALAVALAGAGQ